jgi:hypothetical protein
MTAVTFLGLPTSYRQILEWEDFPMDEKTRLLVSLGAAVAANCVPCFEHYRGKAATLGLAPEEIQEATDIADQVKSGARITTMSSIRGMMGTCASSWKSKSDKPCCG